MARSEAAAAGGGGAVGEPASGGGGAAAAANGGAADASTSFKDEGNAEFKAGNYLKAAALYTRGLKAADPDSPDSAVLLSNRSAALLHLSKTTKALADADACIRLRPEWEKGYWRKAAALEMLERLDEVGAACWAEQRRAGGGGGWRRLGGRPVPGRRLRLWCLVAAVLGVVCGALGAAVGLASTSAHVHSRQPACRPPERMPTLRRRWRRISRRWSATARASSWRRRCGC